MNQLPHRGAIGESETRWQKKLFLLCGNHSEFAYWARKIIEETDEYTVIYTHEPRIVRGYQAENYICLGNWFTTRLCVREIIHTMRASNFRELKYSDIFKFENEEEERNYYAIQHGEFLSVEEMWI